MNLLKVKQALTETRAFHHAVATAFDETKQKSEYLKGTLHALEYSIKKLEYILKEDNNVRN